MSTDSNKYEPPVEMRRFVQMLLDEGVLGNRKEAERRTGVDRGRFYYLWHKEPLFREWYSRQCDEELLKHEPAICLGLIQKAKAGDVSAIKMYFELIGKVKIGINIKAITKNQTINKAQDSCPRCSTLEEISDIDLKSVLKNFDNAA